MYACAHANIDLHRCRVSQQEEKLLAQVQGLQRKLLVYGGCDCRRHSSIRANVQSRVRGKLRQKAGRHEVGSVARPDWSSGPSQNCVAQQQQVRTRVCMCVHVLCELCVHAWCAVDGVMCMVPVIAGMHSVGLMFCNFGCLPARPPARTQARTHARTHARTQARTHTHTHTCSMCVCGCMCACMCACTCLCVRACMRACV